MPTINVNRKVIDKIIGKKLPESELKDRISMLGTDLEEVTDTDITVEIFPNRPDMLSEQGLGRALASFTGTKPGLKSYEVKASGKKVIVSKGMEKIRPYTVCAILKDLKLDEERIQEIINIQEKLHITFCRKRKKAAIGIYPAEKIKFPIHFTARKPEEIIFRPLEWNKEISAKDILNNHPTGVKYKDLVKGLEKYAIFHDDEGKILSFTPVINSHDTGRITEHTKEAFLEVSGFDLHTANYVLNILVAALADMGAKIYSMEVVYPEKTIVTPDLEPKEMDIDLKYMNRWLGLSLKEKEMEGLLERMGMGYKKGKALIPAYRADILHQVDIAEDIAIAYGYEKFTPEIPSKATTGKEDRYDVFRKKVSGLMIGLNMLETSSYYLANKDIQTKQMCIAAEKIVELSNSQSEEHNIMRRWMLPNLMQILKENTHNEYPQDIFETGTIFMLDSDTETGVLEKESLAFLMCGNDPDYTKIRQKADYLMRSLGLPYEIKEAEHPSFISGRCAELRIGKSKAGFLGEISPVVLENFEVDMPVAAAEIDLELIFKALSEKKL